MYRFKQERMDEIKKYNINELADKIGISRVYLSYVIHNKYDCKKTIAFCITKNLDNNKEIDYYFDKI